MFVLAGCGSHDPRSASSESIAAHERSDVTLDGDGEEDAHRDLAAAEEPFGIEGVDYSVEEVAEAPRTGGTITDAAAKPKTKKKKYTPEQLARYEQQIAEQFAKGDRFAQKNAEFLKLNTRQYVWPAGRSKTDPHDRYIVSRAYHDHMKLYYKGYAPNKANYIGIAVAQSP